MVRNMGTSRLPCTNRVCRAARIAVTLLAAATATSLVTACGSSSSTSSVASSSSAAASVSCGTPATTPPIDPDHALAALGPTYQANYDFYPQPVVPSPWAHWKPKRSSGWVVGFLLNPLLNPQQIQVENAVVATLKENPRVARVITAAPTTADVTTQIALFKQLLLDKPDIIIAETLAAPPFDPLITQAGREGIPTIAFAGTQNSPYAVNINTNAELSGVQVGTVLAKLMGGKGNLLDVRAVPGVSLFDQINDGVLASVHTCPGIKLVGTVVGQSVPGTAKSEVLQFLSTHPQPVNGVTEDGSMTIGIFSAFEQAGRPVPPVGDNIANVASLAWWEQHVSKGYRGVASMVNILEASDVDADVALRMLYGEGLKLNSIIYEQPIATNATLSKYVQPGYSVQSPEPFSIPLGLPTKQYLDGFFNNPKVGLTVTYKLDS
jgi:ribose transport system substrate-binding protein